MSMQESMLRPQFGEGGDKVESALRGISQNIGVFLFGLLPLFFVPIAFIPLDYVKIVATIFGAGAILIFWSLLMLRSGKISLRAPLFLWLLWGVALSTSLSAFLSGDIRDSFVGDDFGVHTAVFTILLAMVATLISQTEHTKSTIMRLYVVYAGSALLIASFHTLRLFFGIEALSFGVFTESTESFVGSWNDVALFFGLTILLSLVALEQLPLTKSGRFFFSLVVGMSLLMLAVVNFFAVWIVLALVSLTVLMYGLSKNRFSEKTLTLEQKNSADSIPSILISMLVFVVSVVFIVGGSAVGGYLTEKTGISYLEVRPSLEATIDVGRSVYHEDAFVGIGANKFVDAWRLYKNPSINETIFWATDFTGGSGYLTTAFVQTGILGVASWVLFLGFFLYAGFVMLFKTTHADRFWYFIGSSSFVAASFIWVMSSIYVPGALMLILGALFTGLVCSSYVALVPTKALELSITSNRKAAFALILCTMLIIVGTTATLYYTAKHSSSVYTFSSAVSSLTSGGNLDVTEENIARAYATYPNELYALQVGAYQLAKVNALIPIQQLTEVQSQELQTSIRDGINAGQIVIASDPTDPQGWSLLGAIFSVLASAQVEGAKDRALEAFRNAQSLDPHNPAYLLREAELSVRLNDLPTARERLREAVERKGNYTEALLLLAQIDIVEGKTNDAIATTIAVTELEPTNPARYYQLGILLSASGRSEEAIASFRRAVALDPNYANARYFLAIGLAQGGDTVGALEQLDIVKKFNPDNAELSALIEQIKTGTTTPARSLAPTVPVTDSERVQKDENTVTSSEAPNTPLVSPVNTVVTDDSEAEEVE